MLAKANELSDNRVRLWDRMFLLEKEIKFFHDNENCPTCKQGIAHDFKESAITNKNDTLASIKEELEVIDADQTQVTARIDDIKQTRQGMIKINEQIKVVLTQIESEKRNYKVLETENASLSIEQDTTESTATLLELKEQLAEIQAKREVLSKRNAVLAAQIPNRLRTCTVGATRMELNFNIETIANCAVRPTRLLRLHFQTNQRRRDFLVARSLFG